MGGPAKYVQRHFEHVTDPRADRGCNHDLLEMVFVALTAAICGANGWADVERFAKAKLDWFDNTSNCRMIAVARHVWACSHGWTRAVPLGHASMGRSVCPGRCGSRDRHRREDAAGFVRSSGWSVAAARHHGLCTTDTRLVLRQMSVGEKSNEIPAVPVLLQLLELEERWSRWTPCTLKPRRQRPLLRRTRTT
ncbi:MAG: transposase family protein [Planctomycetaceae bacterium]